MKSIRDNSPIMAGWFAYFVFTKLLSAALLALFLLEIRFFLPPSSSQEKSTTFGIILSVIFSAFAGYISFLISVRWVALSIFERARNIAGKSKLDFLFFEWAEFIFYTFIYSLPTIAVSFYSDIIPVSKEIQDIIIFVWKTIVSFVVYKNIVSYYMLSLGKTATNENAYEPTAI